jgi:hypothetical protein
MGRGRRRLHLETLEARSLLSGLTFSLTTDESTYQVGQTIQITFTETNTSTQPVTVAVAPADFTVSQGAYAIWQSDPNNENQSPTSETLQPGQSLTQSASWDGTTPDLFDDAPASPINFWGTFVVSNQDCPVNVSGARCNLLLFKRLSVISTVFDLNSRVALSHFPMELCRALLGRKSRISLALRAKINRFNITKFRIFMPQILSDPERLFFRENPYKQGTFARKTHH